MGRLAAAILCVFAGLTLGDRPDAKARLQSLVSTAKGAFQVEKRRSRESSKVFKDAKADPDEDSDDDEAAGGPGSRKSSHNHNASNMTTEEEPVVVFPPNGTDQSVVNEINFAMGNESAVQDQLDAKLAELTTQSQESITGANDVNSKRLRAYSDRNAEFEEQLTNTLIDIAGPHEIRMASHREKAELGDFERNAMQSTLNFVKNGLTRQYCPPPVFTDAAATTTKVRISNDDPMYEPGEATGEPLLNNRRFTTFEIAWRICGETPGCGQVVKQEGTGTATVNGETVDLADKYNGFALRRKSDQEYDQNTVSSIPDAVGKEVGKITYTGVDYACNMLCPAVCQNMKSKSVCLNCASATKRECSVCGGDDPTRSGCSGKCAKTFVDCRACSQVTL